MRFVLILPLCLGCAVDSESLAELMLAGDACGEIRSLDVEHQELTADLSESRRKAAFLVDEALNARRPAQKQRLLTNAGFFSGRYATLCEKSNALAARQSQAVLRLNRLCDKYQITPTRGVSTSMCRMEWDGLELDPLDSVLKNKRMMRKWIKLMAQEPHNADGVPKSELESGQETAARRRVQVAQTCRALEARIGK